MKILNVAKAALFGIYLNYYCYYVLYGEFIPRGTVLFLAAAGLCVGMDVIKQRYIHISPEVGCWLLYGVLAFVATAFMELDGRTDFVSEIIKYLQRVGIIMMVAYICERERSVKFGLRLMAVTAVAMAISVLMVTGDIQRKLDITSGAELSANDTGAIMAFGCFAILFAWGKRGRSRTVLSVLKIAAIICCVSVIFLTGSRKSIGAVVIMLVVMALLCLPDYSRRLDLRGLFTLLAIGAAAYWFISRNLLPYAEETNLYERLFGSGAEAASASDQVRIDLYVWALEDFLENPLFGVGFNQFKRLHGNYTHSTYAEPFACSGLLGLLYLYPYYNILKRQILLIFSGRRGSYARVKQKELFAYLCMFLFVGVGIPFMYKDPPCIVLGTFLASQAISLDELRSTGQIHSEY